MTPGPQQTESLADVKAHDTEAQMTITSGSRCLSASWGRTPGSTTTTRASPTECQ